ncbi:MAG: hypothetical protein ACR2N9_04285, partial [Acidimicrobiia bacterium]
MVGSNEAAEPALPLVDRIIGLIAAEPGSARSIMLERFARSYLKRLPDDDEAEISDTELLAEISDLLTFIDECEPGERAVRVFVPTLDTCGYAIPGCVLQVVGADGPFLVDSVSAAVAREGYDTVRHLHPVIGTTRGADGRLAEIATARGSSSRESVQHFELDRMLDADEQKHLEAVIHGVLEDISATTDDFEPMRNAAQSMAATAKTSVHHYDFEEISETVEFLE